jgi:hypothetical protein
MDYKRHIYQKNKLPFNNKSVKNKFDITKQDKYKIEFENYINIINKQFTKEICLIDEILDFIYEKESVYWFDSKRTELNDDIVKKVNQIIIKKMSTDYMTKLSLILYDRMTIIIKKNHHKFTIDKNIYNETRSKLFNEGRVDIEYLSNLDVLGCFDILESAYMHSEYEVIDKFISLVNDYFEEIFCIFQTFQINEADIFTEALIEEYFLLLLCDPFFNVSNNILNYRKYMKNQKFG